MEGIEAHFQWGWEGERKSPSLYGSVVAEIYVF